MVPPSGDASEPGEVGLIRLAAIAAALATATATAEPRLAVELAGTENAWISYGGRPAFGYGYSPQHILTKLPVGPDLDPDFDFRDFAAWAAEHGVTVVRSYPPSFVVGPRYLDLFERREDGRFDLERFHEPYFERLREACALFRDHGIFVHLQLWQAVTWKKRWEDCYYHPDRNANPAIAQHARPGGFVIPPRRGPELVAHQKEHVRRLLDATADLGNVYYDVMNEIGNGTGVNADWVEAILDEVEGWERARGIDVLVGLNDEGQNRPATGRALENPRLELSFVDSGRGSDHVEVRRRHGKPTLGVRNLDTHPGTGHRVYFALARDLSINPDPTLHERSRRMYWRLFLAGVQMNPGYADYGRFAYRGGAFDAFGIPAVTGVVAWDGRRELRIEGDPPRRSGLLFPGEGAGATAVVLVEEIPGEAGSRFVGAQIVLRDVGELEPAGVDLAAEFIDLGAGRRHTGRIAWNGPDLWIPLPEFTGALALVLSDGDAVVTATHGPPEPRTEPRRPTAEIVRVDSDRVVLWAGGNLGPSVGAFRWERRENGGEWEPVASTGIALFADRDVVTGRTYEYRVRATTGDVSTVASAVVSATPARASLAWRLRVLWWRYPGLVGGSAVLAALGAILVILGAQRRTISRRSLAPRRAPRSEEVADATPAPAPRPPTSPAVRSTPSRRSAGTRARG